MTPEADCWQGVCPAGSPGGMFMLCPDPVSISITK